MPVLVLRNPDWHDILKTDTQQVNRHNLGGQLITVRPPTWVAINEYRFTVSALSRTILDAALAFLQTNRGQEITFFDCNDDQWTGIIINNPVCKQVGRDCMHEIELVLQGTFLTPGPIQGGIDSAPVTLIPIPNSPVQPLLWLFLTEGNWLEFTGEQWVLLN